MRSNPTPYLGPHRYGAPMGRYTGPDYLCAEAGRIQLRRIRINPGGYDPGGAYWGLGAPLYWACDPDGNEVFFRAASREAAKRHICETYGPCRFYR